MAAKYPYVSGSGPLVQTAEHLRKSFPPVVDSDTLKKLGIAPSNESFVINILRFAGVLDEEGKKTDAGSKAFAQHEDGAFQMGLGNLVKEAYSELFALHGEDAWTLDLDQLITFFRSSDETSAVVGRRQATTFQTLSSLAGHGELPPAKGPAPAKSVSGAKKPSKKASLKPTSEGTTTLLAPTSAMLPIGMTVRIEINLPSDADQETYDRIFRSIRENLLNA
jgi:hypothetical protein